MQKNTVIQFHQYTYKQSPCRLLTTLAHILTSKELAFVKQTKHEGEADKCLQCQHFAVRLPTQLCFCKTRGAWRKKNAELERIRVVKKSSPTRRAYRRSNSGVGGSFKYRNSSARPTPPKLL